MAKAARVEIVDNAGRARRWDGSVWHETPLPFTVTAIDQRYGEPWAVGNVPDDDLPAAARWNGASWTMTRMPAFPHVLAGRQIGLRQVAVAGRGDVWAQGTISADCDEDCGRGRILLMHWHGGTWGYSLRCGMRPVLVSRIDRRRLTGLWYASDDVSLYMSDGRWERAVLPGDPPRDNHVNAVAVRQGSPRPDDHTGGGLRDACPEPSGGGYFMSAAC
ncbi:hypothetical protein J5X84_27435 [Streptosporangiaceae bacterium NEAU-GS5]|nr:hypothetical protein [Streptosporangiaceae bacterium NEAU-GS5]